MKLVNIGKEFGNRNPISVKLEKINGFIFDVPPEPKDGYYTLQLVLFMEGGHNLVIDAPPKYAAEDYGQEDTTAKIDEDIAVYSNKLLEIMYTTELRERLETSPYNIRIGKYKISKSDDGEYHMSSRGTAMPGKYKDIETCLAVIEFEQDGGLIDGYIPYPWPVIDQDFMRDLIKK